MLSIWQTPNYIILNFSGQPQKETKTPEEGIIMSLHGALTITETVLGDSKAEKNAGLSATPPTADSVPKDGCLV